MRFIIWFDSSFGKYFGRKFFINSVYIVIDAVSSPPPSLPPPFAHLKERKKRRKKVRTTTSLFNQLGSTSFILKFSPSVGMEKEEEYIGRGGGERK